MCVIYSIICSVDNWVFHILITLNSAAVKWSEMNRALLAPTDAHIQPYKHLHAAHAAYA